MAQQIPVDPSSVAEDDGNIDHEIAPDIVYKRLVLVNVVFLGDREAGDRGWVLVDTGVGGIVDSAHLITDAAEERFGPQARPAAILMTHGHFDHVGALEELAQKWDVPVYAHQQEIPYLDGSTPYPPPDPTVGGGLMAALSAFYPTGPVNVGPWLRPLPADGSVPPLPGWQWMHTPGHTPGHVSFWREADRTLLAGDAFITTAQESAYAVATQRPELHGPPMYFTPDWVSARTSVERLAALKPELVVTGHGPALRGAAMRVALETLARDFDRVAVPHD